MRITETINSPHQSDRGKHIPRLNVLHIAEGTYSGTKAWFLNPASQVSSTFLIAKDGRICQCVPIGKMAWCNGTDTVPGSSRHFGHSTVPLVRALGGNANQYSISVEFEGFWSEAQGAITEQQLKAAVWLIGHIQKEVQRLYGYTIPMNRECIVGHYQVNPRTKPHCPGEKFPWDVLLAKLGGKPEPAVLYRVQVGAFGVRENALRFRDETVIPKGVDAFIVQGKDSKSNPLWRVQVGAFSVRGNADNYLKEVQAKGLEAFLVVEAEQPQT